MNHDSLKTEIKTATATTRTQRAEATKLLNEGRDLRKQAKATNDSLKLAEGWNRHSTGMLLRSEADSGTQDRRAMHLAAAALNGRVYSQCESKCESKPWYGGLALCLLPYLPADRQTEANNIAKAWLANDIKLRDLLVDALKAA